MRSEVDSDGLVDEAGVVEGRVTSGGHGRNFVVVRLIVGRVVNIEESDGELSELDELSVDSTDEVDEISEVISPPVDKSVDESVKGVEDVTPISIVVEPYVDASVDPAVDSVVLLKSSTSIVVDE